MPWMPMAHSCRGVDSRQVPSAYWVAGFQELSQRHRVQTMTHSRTKKRHPAAVVWEGS